MDSEKTLLEEANRRVRALDGAILLAEVPETTSSIGVVEIAFDRTPSGEGSYYVVFDSERRHPYSPIDPGAPLPPEDLAVVRAAVEAAAPDEPWVRYGLDREVTPLGFRPDGEPYTAEEAREELGGDFEMIGSELGHEEGLTVSELIAAVPNAGPSERLHAALTISILEGIHDRSNSLKRYGDIIEKGGRLRVSDGLTAQGHVYKDPLAFASRGDEVAYIPEAALAALAGDEEGRVALDDIDPDEVYTYADILEAAQGSRGMAELIFEQLDWQHPSTVYDEAMDMTLSEDWDAAPSRARVADLDRCVRLYAECRLREAGLEGPALEHAMGLTVAEVAEAIGEPRPALGPAVGGGIGYRLLSRLRSDCEYMLGAGGPGAERQLWAGSVEGQIAKMREVYASLPEPPEWLSAGDIDRYEQDMRALLEAQGGDYRQEEGRGAPGAPGVSERGTMMASGKASVYVANLGKYNEGELVGGWISLPVPEGELDRFLEEDVGLELDPGRAFERGMAGERVYEEYAVHDYDYSGILLELGYRPGEHEDLRALNDMAALAAEAGERDLQAVSLVMENGAPGYAPDEVSNLLIQADEIPFYPFDYELAHVKDSWGETCLERMSPEENLAYTLLDGSSEMKALDDAGLLDYFDFKAYGESAAQEFHLADEGYMPADADWPDTDLYDRDEIAELAREARGEARPVPLGSARPAPSPYTPQADMRGVQAPAREATPRRERAELAR